MKIEEIEAKFQEAASDMPFYLFDNWALDFGPKLIAVAKAARHLRFFEGNISLAETILREHLLDRALEELEK